MASFSPSTPPPFLIPPSTTHLLPSPPSPSLPSLPSLLPSPTSPPSSPPSSSPLPSLLSPPSSLPLPPLPPPLPFPPSSPLPPPLPPSSPTSLRQGCSWQAAVSGPDGAHPGHQQHKESESQPRRDYRGAHQVSPPIWCRWGMGVFCGCVGVWVSVYVMFFVSLLVSRCTCVSFFVCVFMVYGCIWACMCLFSVSYQDS